MLDSVDARLVALLVADSTISNAELARLAGLSASACWRRVKSLEERGVITGYGAVVDPIAAGRGFEAIVHVRLVRHDKRQVNDFLRAVVLRDEVEEVFATTGKADYHLRVACADLAAYNRFLEEFLFEQSAVASAETNVVLRAVKRRQTLQRLA